MIIKTDLEYTYEPSDLFDAPVRVEIASAEVLISAGRATVTIPAPSAPIDRQRVEHFTAAVRGMLRARQLITRRPCKSDGPTITHYDDEGRRHHVLLAETGRYVVRGFPPTITVTNPAGGVIYDSSAAEMARDQDFFRQVAPRIEASPVLQGMLQSYCRAIDDPANELVYLYEVRDSAVQLFGREDKALAALGLTKADWDSLGRLANDGTMRQGRHRGRRSGALRDATDDELDEARRIARSIIESLAKTL